MLPLWRCVFYSQIGACGSVFANIALTGQLSRSENAGYSNTVFGLGPRTSCIELAGFFFAIGIFMWVVLFTITFFCVATTHNTVEGVRGSA